MAGRKMYGKPMIGRAGLGNELFPWARCMIWCHQTGAALAPFSWRRLHVGPYLRNESDKRQYHRELKGFRSELVGLGRL